MELVSFLGIGLGLFAVFGGALLEGLHLTAILQFTAAVIVFGGTIGATLLSTRRKMSTRFEIDWHHLSFKKFRSCANNRRNL